MAEEEQRGLQRRIRRRFHRRRAAAAAAAASAAVAASRTSAKAGERTRGGAAAAAGSAPDSARGRAAAGGEDDDELAESLRRLNAVSGLHMESDMEDDEEMLDDDSGSSSNDDQTVCDIDWEREALRDAPGSGQYVADSTTGLAVAASFRRMQVRAGGRSWHLDRVHLFIYAHRELGTPGLVPVGPLPARTHLCLCVVCGSDAHPGGRLQWRRRFL
jgi:hypothetical protein